MSIYTPPEPEKLFWRIILRSTSGQSVQETEIEVVDLAAAALVASEYPAVVDDGWLVETVALISPTEPPAE